VERIAPLGELGFERDNNSIMRVDSDYICPSAAIVELPSESPATPRRRPPFPMVEKINNEVILVAIPLKSSRVY
jgi:hypothetical protein